ncbi:heavy metal translocating P-type ATPase [Actinophytocola sp.]|uniref:heavy metal translocating P-type ATPase n=1 Tax=Actinophytocola sp. TaxID=1872138 RepID=UPI003D6C6E21
MLSASGVLAIEAPRSLKDVDVLKTAAAGGLVLEPEQPATLEENAVKRQKWWLRPPMVLLGIAVVFMIAANVTNRISVDSTLARSLAAVAIAAGIIYPARNAWALLKNRRLSINALLVVTVAGALPLGKVVECGYVVVIFSLGAVLETFVADRARRSIQNLMDLTPRRAERFAAGGYVETVAVEELQVDDVVLVRPGARLPTDGVVIEGSSWVDNAAITGESMPQETFSGEPVYGGTLNGDGALRIRVTRRFEDAVLVKVIHEVEEAQQNRGNAQRFAEKFGMTYTPLMIVVAVLMAVLGPTVFGLPFEDAWYRALVVLIVSCSCALVVSVPATVIAAVARAARDGVLVKGGAYLELLTRVRAVAFDKTGTLTLGRPRLTSVHPLAGHDEQELLRLAAAVESTATHPIAEAIVHAARDRGVEIRPAADARMMVGMGAEATVDGRRIVVGRAGDYSDDQAALAALAAVESAAATPVAVTADDTLIGLLGLADQPRPEAVEAIAQLRELGITHTTMLTGDRQKVARVVADQLGVENVSAELMPKGKSAAVAGLKKRHGVVVMVGDGVNDAPAMATADVAVVMGAVGTDVATETADVALMSDDLTKLPQAISLARRANRIIAQNMIVALTVVAALVVAAVSGAFNLIQGVLVNEAFAILVISNGLRLLRGRKPATATEAPAATATEAPASSSSTAAALPAPVAAGDGCGDGCGCGTSAKAEPVVAASAAGDGCGDGCGCGTSDGSESITLQRPGSA